MLCQEFLYWMTIIILYCMAVGITSLQHKGYMCLICSHLTMHSWWNIWLHGIVNNNLTSSSPPLQHETLLYKYYRSVNLRLFSNCSQVLNGFVSRCYHNFLHLTLLVLTARSLYHFLPHSQKFLQVNWTDLPILNL